MAKRRDGHHLLHQHLFLSITSAIHNVKMKVYETNSTYDYPLPTVTLAYFLRYPNPYARHVLSTDVIDRCVEPETQRLHTLRLHLKKSKVPAPILRFLPRGMVGPNGASQTYILERSTIDLKEGWMKTESRNMEWTGILSVVERQQFEARNALWKSGAALSDTEKPSISQDSTACKTTVTFVSKIGQARAAKRRAQSESSGEEQEEPKPGFFASLSAAGIQGTVELVGVKRTKTALVNGKEGMNVVLERLRAGGILGVFEGIRRDHSESTGGEGGAWKQVWRNGFSSEEDVSKGKSE